MDKVLIKDTKAVHETIVKAILSCRLDDDGFVDCMNVGKKIASEGYCFERKLTDIILRAEHLFETKIVPKGAGMIRVVKLTDSAADFIAQTSNKHKTLEEYTKGEYVNGTIVEIRPSSVSLDIDGVKCVVPINELSREKISSVYDVLSDESKGMIMKVEILGINIKLGILNGRCHSLDNEHVKSVLQSPKTTPITKKAIDFTIGDYVNGVITKISSKSVIVDVDGIKCHIPKQEVTKDPSKDVFSVFQESDKGKSIPCLVVAINEKTNNALLSYRQAKNSVWNELKKTYSDQKIGVVVSEIIDGTVYVTFQDNVRCRLKFSSYNENAINSLKEGDSLEVMLHAYNEMDDIIELVLDSSYYSYYNESGEVELRSIKQGDLFDAKVTAVSHNKATVSILDTDIISSISRFRLSPNRTIDATEEVFPGEYLQLVFSGINRGKFLFERKSLLEDVYAPELYEESIERILATMGIFTNKFKGTLVSRLVKNSNKWFITNVISSDENDKQSFGKLLVDPVRGIYPEVLVENTESLTEDCENRYYEFSLYLTDDSFRKYLGSPYLFTTDGNLLEEVPNPYEEFVTVSYKKNDSPSSNVSLAHLLEEVGQNLYSSKKRMFFELLQNADDSAPEMGTRVRIQICKNHFVITHNGLAFNKNDFDSIISAAQSTKSAQANKTGYKGIGFKSVFTNSHIVKINSRGFTFAFDKSYDEYNSFERFYFHIRDIQDNIEEQEKFIKKYQKEYNEFDGVKVIPWQLLPIWHDTQVIEEDSIFNEQSNVSIALNMSPETLAEYDVAIEEVFNEPRFMLFLRNTKRVQFVKDSEIVTIQKNYSKKNSIVNLVNSKDNSSKEDSYRIFSIDNFVVDNDGFKKAGIPIKRTSKINVRGEKQDCFVRVDENGNELSEVSGIPDRIASATSATISFALKLDENKKLTQIKDTGKSFYAYLPMNESHFSFPFYVNADFIPKSDREGLQTDNPWNHYLFYAIGRSIIDMVSNIASVNEPEYLTLLPSKELSEKETEQHVLSAAFNNGYKEAIKSTAFVINDLGVKVNVSDICYDASGFSSIVGSSCFYTLTGTTKRLPHTSLNADILKHKIFGVEQFTTNDIISLIIKNAEVVKVFLSDGTTRKLFFNWVASDDNITTQLIDKIPLLKIGEEWVKRDGVYLRDNRIITTTKLSCIKNELTKLGFECTDYLFEDHPLYKNIRKQTEYKVYEAITKKDASVLCFEERYAVFNVACTLDKVTSEELKGWNIFKNELGVLTPMANLCSYKDDAPSWLLPYMIAKGEYNENIQKHLVPSDRVYVQIIKKYIDSILTTTQPVEVFRHFPEWESTLTQKLISKDVDKELLLPLAELSDASTKEKFLKSIKTIEINSSNEYGSDSFVYRVLQLTANCENALNYVRSIIKIDNQVLSENTLSDTFHVTINNVSYAFTLSVVLPFFTQSSLSNKVISSFSTITGYSKIFGEKELSASSVKDKLIEYISKNPVLLNGEQFCFLAIYYSSKNYSCLKSDIRKYVNINDQSVIKSIFEISISNGFGKTIGTFVETPNILRPFDTIKDKFIGCDHITLEEERVPAFIRNWSTAYERRQFLSGIGVKDDKSKEIYRRRSFLDKKNESDIWNLNQIQKQTFFKWLVLGKYISLPLNDTNQITILQLLGSKEEIVESDLTNTVEWENEKYDTWKQTNSLRVYIQKTDFPVRGKYDQTVLYHTAIKKDYVFFINSKKLYVGASDIQTVLSQVISDSQIPFNKDDWNSLFMVSIKELEELKRQNELLSQELERVKEYRDSNNSEVDDHGRYTESDNTDPETRKQINREARIAAYEFLSSLEDYDCTEWNPEDSSHIVKNQIRYKGHYITVAVTSSRGRKLYLHPWLFAEIMENPDNLLLNYGFDNQIHSLSFSDVFMDNPNVNLIFDTDVVSPEEIAKLANKYRVSKRTCFVIENPKYSQSASIQSFGLNEKKEDGYVNVSFSDDDIFNF